MWYHLGISLAAGAAYYSEWAQKRMLFLLEPEHSIDGGGRAASDYWVLNLQQESMKKLS